MRDAVERAEIDGRTVTVYPSGIPGAPTVYASMYSEVGSEVLRACSGFGCPAFNLVSVSDLDWDTDLSPWPADSIMHGGGFGGGADGYARFLTGDVIPFAEGILGVSRRVVAGYSMGGLFALYAPYVTDAFSACVSASGSLWFPGFAEFVEASVPVRLPDAAYLSLGDREHRTRNPVMRTVGDLTRRVFGKLESEGVEMVFELNPGNHFVDCDLRLAKGISWVLGRLDGRMCQTGQCSDGRAGQGSTKPIMYHDADAQP